MVEVRTFIHTSQEACFDLARNPAAHIATTGHTRERIVEGKTDQLLELGDEITFEATHFGVRQRLTARITEFDRPNFFTDEMVKGAFRSLKHCHRFEKVKDGT